LIFLAKIVSSQSTQKEKIHQGIILDEVMIKAVYAGFDVKGFVEKVKHDTTFYKAFKTLRLHSYHMYNDIVIEDRDENEKASYNSLTFQEVKNNCRSMTVKSEKVKGNFYKKNHSYRYRTASLYAHLFFTKGTICNENNIVGNKMNSGSAKYEEQLRQLIFNPGKRISGIPGIGDNIAIFDEPYFSKYRFRLSRVLYNNEDCYVFRAIPKPAYINSVVINELTTWFRVSDFSIVARDYSLSFKTLFYDFDVVMHVKLKPLNNDWVPYEINYKGNWHVLTQSREIASFTAIFTDFE